LDNIKNNTDVLVDQDITSLLKKPPLDSMDLIREKFLDLAKKNKIVLNTEELGVLLDNYRTYLLNCCESIKDIRLLELNEKVEKASLKKEGELIKINKKDFTSINKKIKKLLKDTLIEGYDVCILKNIDMVFIEVEDSVKERIIDDISKYIKGNYQKQLLENLDIKILVKDTTLMNGTKEQGERYLFTLNHSRLLNEMDS
jgi:hypothetical protein